MSCSTWCAPFPWYSHVCLLFLTSWLLFTPRCIRKRWNASLLSSLNSSRLSRPAEGTNLHFIFTERYGGANQIMAGQMFSVTIVVFISFEASVHLSQILRREPDAVPDSRVSQYLSGIKTAI